MCQVSGEDPNAAPTHRSLKQVFIQAIPHKHTANAHQSYCQRGRRVPKGSDALLRTEPQQESKLWSGACWGNNPQP